MAMTKYQNPLLLCTLLVTLATAIHGGRVLREEVYGNGEIYDISHRYVNDMPLWGSKEGIGQFVWLMKSMKNGSLSNESEMKLSVHSGTHVDAPGHVYDSYFDEGFDVDSLDLQVLNDNNLQLHQTKSTTMIKQHLLLLFTLLSCAYLHTVFSFSPNDAYPAAVDGSCSGPISTDDDLLLVPNRREVYGKGKIIDISHVYVNDMPSWDSKDGIGQFIWLFESLKNGSIANFSKFKLSVHSGTHVDAPGHVYDHYYDAGFDVDTLDLEVLNGPALLVDVPRDSNITAEVMKSLKIPKGVRRVLFRTLNTDR
ncbi:hypothetical protein JCGZ_22131 [Jatropha curcas]|uniref:Cyclase family protein n=1 Tax=Jatropha curcas TaxID=180498 RepID=A0A067LQC2_JATCU|nr:hypothetical protein JCGZ_22131 [Jatropha curcas]